MDVRSLKPPAPPPPDAKPPPPPPATTTVSIVSDPAGLPTEQTVKVHGPVNL